MIRKSLPSRKETVMENVEKALYTETAHTAGGQNGMALGSEGRLDVKRSSAGGAGSSTLLQRVAICFAAGVLGGLAVVLFSHVLFQVGISATLGVSAPVSLQSPDIYRPLFWAGLWGIPFGLLIKTVWRRLYLFGLLYFLAPVLALFTIFLPAGALQQGGLGLAVYLVLVNLPYGIMTALAARAIIGKKP
jgi:hypothetical protein